MSGQLFFERLRDCNIPPSEAPNPMFWLKMPRVERIPGARTLASADWAEEARAEPGVR